MVQQIDGYITLNIQPLNFLLDTDDLKKSTVELRSFAIGALDRCRQSTFIAWNMLCGSDDFIQEPTYLRELFDADSPEPKSFGLHKKLKKGRGAPWRRGKRKHRFGYFTRLSKDKVLRKVENQEEKNGS